MVRTSTRTAGLAATMRRVASMPSVPGIRMSISTTSGGLRRAKSTASSPSPASPVTAQVVFGLDDHAEPAAQQRLVVGQQHGDAHAVPPAAAQGGRDEPAPVRRGAGGDGAVVQGGPLAHPVDAVPLLPAGRRGRAVVGHPHLHRTARHTGW